MGRSIDQLKAIFDRWACTYDQSLAESSDGPLTGYVESLRLAASCVPVMPGQCLLDIGIGTGALAALLAVSGAIVSGVDISAEMLDRCQQAHPEFDLSLGSFESLPHPDCSFDVVVSSFAFHHVAPAERVAALTEAARVMQPGGNFGLVDIFFASAAGVDAARALLGDLWDDEETYGLVGDVDAALREAGFMDCTWTQASPFHWFVIARRA